jgi:hypothetical protein
MALRTQTAKVSSKYQIVIPKRVRQARGRQGGNVPPAPQYAQHLRGLHKEVWKDSDAAEYVRKEREAWER